MSHVLHYYGGLEIKEVEMGGSIDNYGKIVNSSGNARLVTKSDVINVAMQYVEDAGFGDVYMIKFYKGYTRTIIRFYSKLRDRTIIVELINSSLELESTKTSKGEVQ